MKGNLFCALALVAFPLVAVAIDPGPSSPQQAETEAWLQMQLRGQVASPIVQTATPAERELSLQRWLDSYKDAIPDFYSQDEGGTTKSSE